ncbi:hypothetical protein [Solibacillus sp. FSL W8-0372]
MAILLLFIVTGSAILYTNAYFAQLKFYNSLEFPNKRWYSCI